tara:strand:- start:213 stop:500 length:288 start_codon:yes stop_codon:yes gene_type:complete
MNLQDNLESKSLRNGNINCALVNEIVSMTEINYLSDSENFISENSHIDFTPFNTESIILFENTTEYFPDLIKLLNNNKIKHTILNDEFDLSFIVI